MLHEKKVTGKSEQQIVESSKGILTALHEEKVTATCRRPKHMRQSDFRMTNLVLKCLLL